MTGLAAVDLSFRYGTQTVLDGISHTFAPGTITALTGASGSGKSTLLYLLGLMLTPSGGAVELDGEPVSAGNDADRSLLRGAHMGFVFQDALLDPARSVLENILEPSLYRSERVDRSAEALGLLTRFGVEVDPGRRPGQLSGGQAQRVALCRALIGTPRILLADEPSGNLDEGSADIVWQAMHDHADAGGTVIVATHDPQRAATCDDEVRITRAAA